ncbi:MAG: protein-glutamate O-methyltransferase CheR [Oleiphilaceae bacterium]|nr:protein-glutamate O-methyltransferase CheR [Oleiphilaceae bacterium]
MNSNSSEPREFPLSKQEFSQLCALAYRYTGIVLGGHKRHMVYGRLVRRLRALRLSDFSQYLPLIDHVDKPETDHFINAITTNLTSFFREQHHFDFIADTAVAQWQQRHTDYRLRLWSAGCSSGEEAYSLAVTLCKNLNLLTWDVKILATDIDSRMLQFAAEGQYEKAQVGKLHQADLEQWFDTDKEAMGLRVKNKVKDLVRFKRLNLLEKWPMKGPFDLIMCRNVMIYFDKPTQQDLLRRFSELLCPGGYLMVGHSETLHYDSELFAPMGKTIYRRRG